jgi:hypothetical protein
MYIKHQSIRAFERVILADLESVVDCLAAVSADLEGDDSNDMEADEGGDDDDDNEEEEEDGDDDDVMDL